MRTSLGRVAVLRGGNTSYNISKKEAITTVIGGLKDLPLFDTTKELSQQVYLLLWQTNDGENYVQQSLIRPRSNLNSAEMGLVDFVWGMELEWFTAALSQIMEMSLNIRYVFFMVLYVCEMKAEINGYKTSE